MSLPPSILCRIQNQHTVLDLLTGGLSDTRLRMMIVPGKWSVFENIVHLEVYQHSFIERINTILEEENPLLNRYTAEADPLFHDSLGQTTEAIMESLNNTRQLIINLISGLSIQELNRKGRHPVYGSMTILQWIEFFLLHEAHHLFTIFKLQAELRKMHV